MPKVDIMTGARTCLGVEDDGMDEKRGRDVVGDN